MGYSSKRYLEEKIALYSGLGDFAEKNFKKNTGNIKDYDKKYNIGIDLGSIIGSSYISYNKQEEPKEMPIRHDSLIVPPSHFAPLFLSDLRTQDVPDSQPQISQEEIQEELHTALCPWISQE